VLSRRGTTLAELLVALVLGAIVLAVATTSVLRQQRATLAMTTGARSATQLRLATAVVQAQATLHGRDDVALQASTDTALQLRATIAVGAACAAAVHPSFAVGGPDIASGGLASPPRVGDSLWWYSPGSDRWSGASIQSVWAESGACGLPSVSDDAGAAVTIRLQRSGADTIPALSPLRITRQERLVLYRAGDGSWHLGLRDWSAATGSFGSPQPVAGPFFRGTSGLRAGFRYFEQGGAEVTLPSMAPSAQPARLRLTLVSPLTVGRATPVGDSVDVSLRAPREP